MSVLTDIIIRKKLYITNKQGHKYIQVEGWTALGGMVGVFARTDYSQKIDRPNDEIAYEAKVSLYNIETQMKINDGEAMCSDKETLTRKDGTKIKRWTDEFTVKSMSITRATGKACRLALSWIVAVSDFETTPAEEMIETPDETEEKPISNGKKESPPPESPKDEPMTSAQKKLIEDTVLKSHLIGEFEKVILQNGLPKMSKSTASAFIDRWLNSEHPIRKTLESASKDALKAYLGKKENELSKKHPDIYAKFIELLETKRRSKCTPKNRKYLTV